MVLGPTLTRITQGAINIKRAPRLLPMASAGSPRYPLILISLIEKERGGIDSELANLLRDASLLYLLGPTSKHRVLAIAELVNAVLGGHPSIVYQSHVARDMEVSRG